MQTQNPSDVLRWEGEEVLADKARPIGPKGPPPRLEDVFPADAVAALRKEQKQK